jgi:hypothetical protein
MMASGLFAAWRSSGHSLCMGGRLIMLAQCPNLGSNGEQCGCTYKGCPRHGLCCECLRYHLAAKQLPACCFPPEVEKTYDRSFARFIKAWS